MVSSGMLFEVPILCPSGVCLVPWICQAVCWGAWETRSVKQQVTVLLAEGAVLPGGPQV